GVAISKPRRRTVKPRDDVLRFVVLVIQLAWHIAAKICDERRLQLRKRSPQQQRVHARMLVRLVDRLVEQRLGLPRSRRPAKQAILFARTVKFKLPGKWRVLELLAECVERADTVTRLRFVCFNPHGRWSYGRALQGTHLQHPIKGSVDLFAGKT